MRETVLQRTLKQQTIASLGFTLSNISRFATRNPNILQTLLQQLTNERQKKNKTKLLLNQANDVGLVNERDDCYTVGLLWGQNQNAFVDIPSKLDGAARTDVLTFMKVQVWTDISFAGSATHDDLSTMALKNKGTYLNPYIYNKGRTAIGFGYWEREQQWWHLEIPNPTFQVGWQDLKGLVGFLQTLYLPWCFSHSQVQ